MLCYVWYVLIWSVRFCYVMWCYVCVLCYVMLCYDMLNSSMILFSYNAMLCYVVIVLVVPPKQPVVCKGPLYIFLGSVGWTSPQTSGTRIDHQANDINTLVESLSTTQIGWYWLDPQPRPPDCRLQTRFPGKIPRLDHEIHLPDDTTRL